ncbi:MAG: tetratricopeptide repeat protein [Alphaproteobacteria bacterium]|nr:tetratricopeptide repeat protein [Alphaproteobacteria bacterium]
MIALWLAAALAQDDEDYRSHVDQAKFFVRKGWYEDAAMELEAALENDNGELDGQAWYLLAEVRYHLGDIEGAMEAADRAHSNSRTPEELELAAGFSTWLHEQFGLVEVETRFDGVQSSVFIQLESLLLDPELKNYLKDLGVRLAEPRPLPIRFGLPVGTYRVNGRPVEIRASERSTVRIPVRGAAPEALQVTELEGSLGVTAWAGSAARGHYPGPTARIGITQPLGGFVLGLAADWSGRTLTTPDGLRFVPADFGLAARFGVEAARIRDAALRAALSGRVARIGGLGLPCAGDASGVVCAKDATPVAWAYPDSFAIVPGLELSAVVLDRRRTTAVGWGVRIVGEAAFGRRPGSGSARMGPDEIPYTVDAADRPFLLGGVRLMGTVVWAR